VTERKGSSAGAWWWFTVSGDNQSYAPFQAVASDTKESVESRVLAYYTNRLFQLTQPTQRGSHWANRGNRNTTAATVPTVVAAPAPDVAE